MGIMTIVGKKIIVNSLIHKLKADPPSIVINVDEIYTTSYILYHWTLTVIQHVGDVSHNVTISGNVIYPDTVSGSKYISTINNLESNTSYNIVVTSTYNNNVSRTFTRSVNTSLPQCKFALSKLLQ